MRPPAPRRLLEARLGLRGLCRDRRPRSTRSAAGPTATPTPFRACSQACPAPKKGLIGPWAHAYPHAAQPGPAIGFLQEALRWWDHWLKGIDTGIMDEPMLRAWMQESVPPATTYAERPGPLDRGGRAGRRRHRSRSRCTSRDRHARRGRRPARRGDRVASSLSTGIAFGEWCPYGLAGELPADQRPDDGRSRDLRHARRSPSGSRYSARRSSTLELASDRPSAHDRGAAGGRRAGRRLDVGHLRPAQSRRIATAMSVRSRWSRAASIACESCSTTSRRPFRPATASAWRWPPRTGRSPGRRPSRPRSRCRPRQHAVAAGARTLAGR